MTNRSESRPRAATIAVAVALLAAALVAVACSTNRARSDDRPAGPAQQLAGQTPSGGSYVFRVRRSKGGGLCERVTVRYPNSEGEISNCQAARGTGAHGMWELDCHSKDLTAFGTAYGKVRSVVMTHPDGARRDARFVGEGGRRAFVLVADGAMLPGDLQALDAKGRIVSSEHFESAAELCASDDTGVSSPLSVNYTF